MVYPDRKVLEVLPDFVGTASMHQTGRQRERLREFFRQAYTAGWSLREIDELAGRSQTAVRRALDEGGVPRRGMGVRPVLPG